MLNGTTISSSVLDHALRQGIGGTIGGYMGGFSSGLIMTGNLKEAHSMGASGASIGLAAGLAQGAASGYIYARRNNLNPWTGKYQSKYNFTLDDMDGNYRIYKLKIEENDLLIGGFLNMMELL